MKPSPIILITRNQGKLLAAKSVFDRYKINLESCNEEFPEIQADSSLEIAKHTALEASIKLDKPVIREDHSLYVNALGIPGPYTSFVEKKLSAEKLLEVLTNFTDRTGYFEIATVYAEPSGLTKEFVYQVNIHIKDKIAVADPRGGWNGILCLENEERAFTEYPEEERLDVWNKNYSQLAEFLMYNSSSDKNPS